MHDICFYYRNWVDKSDQNYSNVYLNIRMLAKVVFKLIKSITFLMVSGGFVASSSALLLGGVLGTEV